MKNLVFKRLLSMALVCLMTMPMLMLGGMSAMAAGEVLYSCKFDGVTTVDDPNTTTVENKASGTALDKFGKDGWINNSTVGFFRYDTVTGRNYIEVNEHGGGGFSLKISDTVITGGKVYVSFSYRKISSNNNSFYIGVDDGNGDNRKVIGRLNKTMGLCTSISAESVSTVGDFTDTNWHEVGFLIDLDTDKVSGYVDGVMAEKQLSLDSTLSGIKRLALYAPNVNSYCGDYTDIVVKHVTGTNEITANTEVGETDIKVTFSEPLGTVINANNVNVELCGTDSELTVTDVKQAGSTLDISYEGVPVAGREYRITCDNAKTVFGNDVAPMYFYAPAVSTVTGLTGASDGSSVVNENGVIDFENLTFAEDTSAKYKPIKVTEPTDFYTYFGTRNTDRANVNVVTVESTGVTNGNSSEYALEGKNASFNFAFGEKLIQNDTRTVVYEFKYLYKSASTNAGKIKLAIMNPDGTNNKNGRIVDMTVDATAWHTMKVVYDRVTPKIDVYKDNELLGSYTKYKTTANPSTEENIPSFVWRIGVDYAGASSMDNISFYIDDFKQSYISDRAGIESVRYVDINNKKSGLDTITPATKAIEIKFSENMTESTLSAINVSNGVVTDRSYNSATCTYTLALENLLTGNAEYTLTVPNTVTAVSGAKLAETVYNFSTTAGEFKMTNLKIETAGAELANVSAVAGTAITVKTDMTNTKGLTGDVTLIYSFYDDDKLVDVNYDTIPLTNGMDTLVSKTFTVKSGITPDSAKAFVWYGSIDALEPIIPAKEY